MSKVPESVAKEQYLLKSTFSTTDSALMDILHYF